MITYKNIYDRAEKNSAVKYHWEEDENAPLRMKEHVLPLSIRPIEFRFIYDFVSRHQLSKGFECATAFGVSMVSAALAMKEHGGRLVTMDAYAEEHFQDLIHTGKERTGKTFRDSDGFKSASWLVEEFELQDVVDLCVGWSPKDTESVLNTTFDLQKDRLDYVFIDAEHIDSALIADIEAIVPYLGKKFALFIHDTHCFTGIAREYVKKKFGKPWIVANGCKFPQGLGFNLSYVTNLE